LIDVELEPGLIIGVVGHLGLLMGRVLRVLELSAAHDGLPIRVVALPIVLLALHLILEDG